MDALKAMKERLKKEKAEAASGDKKYITKAELEAARLRKLREEEEKERQEKGKKREMHSQEQQQPAKQAKTGGGAEQVQNKPPAQLPRHEVIRRLRALGQPATLFGEEDSTRLQRLLRAEKEMLVEDDTLGGQQENVLLGLSREQQGKHRGRAGAGAGAGTSKAAAAGEDGKGKGGAGAEGADGRGKEEGKGAAPGAEAGPSGSTALVAPEPEDPTLASFKRAAAMLADKRAEEAMCIEERINKWIRKWTKEWEEDLDRRPDEIKNSGSGHQTTLMFQQTMKYFDPLYDRLKHKVLHEELRAGLWMMISAMRERNYLAANDIYLKLAIGNSPWPIGVTQVGIHERSAREKISHVMNQSGMAHIMNDEATRKYFQAFKRLITFVQRAYPTDPSRSINFQTGADMGRGVSGAGSDKLALLEAEAKGEDWRSLGLEEAPHFLEKDGSIQVPTKWKYILGRAKDAIREPGEGGREGTPPLAGKAAGRDGTPPPAAKAGREGTPPPAAKAAVEGAPPAAAAAADAGDQ